MAHVSRFLLVPALFFLHVVVSAQSSPFQEVPVLTSPAYFYSGPGTTYASQQVFIRSTQQGVLLDFGVHRPAVVTARVESGPAVTIYSGPGTRFVEWTGPPTALGVHSVLVEYGGNNSGSMPFELVVDRRPPGRS